MKAAAILAALVVPALVPSAVAEEAGQYAVAVFNSPNVSGLPHALIVDTKNGYVWEWFGGMSCPTCTNLYYQGQATPGKDSGPSGAKSPQRQ